MKILVLDDAIENLKAAKIMLESLGHAVICATNYKEAREIVNKGGERINIALIDLNFPSKEGGEPKRLGYRFRRNVLMPQFISSVIATGGHHHNMDSTLMWSMVSVKFMQDNFDRGERYMQAGLTKDNPETWEIILEALLLDPLFNTLLECANKCAKTEEFEI